MGMYDREVGPAEQPIQFPKSNEIRNRIYCATHLGDDHHVNASMHAMQNTSTSPERRTTDQCYLIALRIKAVHCEQRILLGTTMDKSGNDVTDANFDHGHCGANEILKFMEAPRPDAEHHQAQTVNGYTKSAECLKQKYLHREEPEGTQGTDSKQAEKAIFQIVSGNWSI